MNKEALNQIAQSALRQYEGDFPTISFFAKETSTVYKVKNAEGEAFALKIYHESATNVMDNEIEVLILSAIGEKGAIPIAPIVKNRIGQNITIIHSKATDTPQRIVLSKWLEGVDFKNNESEERFVELGGLLAKLHLITKDIVLPQHLIPKKWNEVFYFREEIPVYHNVEYNEQVSSRYKQLMDKAIPLLNKKLAEIYNITEPQLLHGDLNPWNIKIVNGDLALLDFEDAILGQPLHDLAILLSYYKEHQTFTYKQVKKWVFEGYTSISHIVLPSDEELEWLAMARTVNFLNYVLTLEGDYTQYITDNLVRLEAFLASVLRDDQ